jgi:hypothetical protein
MSTDAEADFCSFLDSDEEEDQGSIPQHVDRSTFHSSAFISQNVEEMSVDYAQEDNDILHGGISVLNDEQYAAVMNLANYFKEHGIQTLTDLFYHQPVVAHEETICFVQQFHDFLDRPVLSNLSYYFLKEQLDNAAGKRDFPSLLYRFTILNTPGATFIEARNDFFRPSPRNQRSFEIYSCNSIPDDVSSIWKKKLQRMQANCLCAVYLKQPSTGAKSEAILLFRVAELRYSYLMYVDTVSFRSEFNVEEARHLLELVIDSFPAKAVTVCCQVPGFAYKKHGDVLYCIPDTNETTRNNHPNSSIPSKQMFWRKCLLSDHEASSIIAAQLIKGGEIFLESRCFMCAVVMVRA